MYDRDLHYNPSLLTKTRLLLGLLGAIGFCLSVIACFLFGLLPILDAIDENDLVAGLACLWLTGNVFWCDAMLLVYREEQKWHGTA